MFNSNAIKKSKSKMANTNVKTPIVYYGGKTALMNHMLPLIPVHDTYTEVFAGGASLFWSKEPVKNETINDRLDIVMNFYEQLKMHFTPLKKLIDSTLISRSMHTRALQTLRIHRTGLSVDKTQLAWAFWVCTNFAYSNKIGGGYKYSNHMSTSIPETLKNRKAEFTENLVRRIENAYLENDDALTILESRNVPTAFHYLDPPYPNADQGHYGGYTWSEYGQLLEWLATKCKGKFLLSGYNSDMLTEFIDKHGWHKKQITHRIQAMSKMSNNGERKNKTETLVRNYDTVHNTLKLFK